ncbi:MAG TPA: HAD family phosphatase [Saprospiraceae bacterium]|nr:HAD family phosphatase [Saprospiraceae bacterium]HMQ84619.1 HAD family phosphatase [Saprospiraceae bacterium]
MDQAKIDTVIFDLGGVLIDWNPEYVFRQVFDDEAEMRYFFDHICTHDWNILQDAGRPLAEATEWLVERHPEYESQIRDYYGRWEDMLGGPIEETVQILEELRAKKEHRLYALTNWSAETFPVALERYGFLHYFEGIVVSGVERLIKPDPRIYELLIQRYEVQAHRAIFIDDNFKNAKGAEAVGLHAIHFQHANQLRSELEQRGIL